MAMNTVSLRAVSRRLAPKVAIMELAAATGEGVAAFGLDLLLGRLGMPVADLETKRAGLEEVSNEVKERLVRVLESI